MHRVAVVLACLLALSVPGAVAQERFEGSAVVRVGEDEYTIPIECDDALRPELGFSTEPSRITRQRTGRTSGINVRLRDSGEPDETVVSLNRYVAWIARPSSTAGRMVLTLDMSPISVVRENQHVLLTRDRWMSGDRPPGVEGVRIEARCGVRDPAAPAHRRVTEGR